MLALCYSEYCERAFVSLNAQLLAHIIHIPNFLLLFCVGGSTNEGSDDAKETTANKVS